MPCAAPRMRPAREAIARSSSKKRCVGEAREAGLAHLERCVREAATAAASGLRHVERRNRPSRSPARGEAAAIRSSRWPPWSAWLRSRDRWRWPASGPTVSTDRPTPPAPSSTRPPRPGRAAQGCRPGSRLAAQRLLRLFFRAGRSHQHGADRHERRRSSDISQYFVARAPVRPFRISRLPCHSFKDV